MKHLICSKCQNPFNLLDKKPFLLPSCGHSICAECLTVMIELAPSEISCPEDGEVCDFYDPARGLLSFPINKAIQKHLLKNHRVSHEFEQGLDSELEELELIQEESSLQDDFVC